MSLPIMLPVVRKDTGEEFCILVDPENIPGSLTDAGYDPAIHEPHCKAVWRDFASWAARFFYDETPSYESVSGYTTVGSVRQRL